MRTKQFTFKSLFLEAIPYDDSEIMLSKIEIPIIQRDYAQGRVNTETARIRSRFLEAIYSALASGKRITLDFVYGDISKKQENKKDVYVLTPLDGQQRLTTLFLLHWYAAKKECISEQDHEFLERFTYTTRYSSRDFCRELVKFSPDFSNSKLSLSILDQAWYQYEWKNDSTILSMLVMIDSIHEKFKGFDNLWDSLVVKENVMFYFLPISDMGLTDELYIKMNSRGKPLTPFEHFKAEFVEIIKQHSEELAKEISHKFDIEWTDMLFPFRCENSIVDDEFMRYFQYISDILSYKMSTDPISDEFEVAESLYSSSDKSARSNIEYLVKSFDCWCGFDIENFFSSFFSAKKYEYGKVTLYQDALNLFRECCDSYGEYIGKNRKFPLGQSLILYSIVTYLQNTETISAEDFKQRVRVIRNLVVNSSDEIREDRMKQLLSEAESIMITGKILASEQGVLGFNAMQKDEERDKVVWLSSNPNLKEVLYRLEDHVLLKGCISVVGLDNIDNFRKFEMLFDSCPFDVIHRVLLSFGDYSQFVSWRYQMGASTNPSAWEGLFHPSRLRQGFEKTKSVLNNLLSLIDESVSSETLEQIVSRYLDDPGTPFDWRYYFIKYGHMRNANYGMYFWRNHKETQNKSYEILMMNTEKSISGKNWNVFLYTLYHLPEFAGKLTLLDYAYQGERLRINNSSIRIDCFNDKFVVTNIETDESEDYQVEQLNGIDLEDRVEKGRQIVEKYI